MDKSDGKLPWILLLTTAILSGSHVENHHVIAGKTHYLLWSFSITNCYSSHYQRVNHHYHWLVVSTPMKNTSQLGWLFSMYEKITNAPNHQPDHYPRRTTQLSGSHSMPLHISTYFLGAEAAGLHVPQPRQLAKGGIRHWSSWMPLVKP